MLQNIEAERKRNKYTKQELVSKLGCSMKTYYNWIHEITDIPSSKLKKMKQILHAESIEYLLESEEEK